MDKEKSLEHKESLSLFLKINELHNDLDQAYLSQFQRSLPLNEELSDRWKRAEKLGFGKESSIYDSSLVFGDVSAGDNCWIGPFTVIDGNKGLKIGNYCTISVGVQIYTHDNIKQTLSSGSSPIERESVTIGDNVYIGPNVIITKGVCIGNSCVIGAFSFVNRDIPDNSIVVGQPAKVRGRVEYKNGELEFVYNDELK